MNKKITSFILNFFRRIFPFLITFVLFESPSSRFNPFGFLAIIPLFFYLFSKPIKYWIFFAFFIGFLLDYNAGTSFLFCSLFLIMFTLNNVFGLMESDGGFNSGNFSIFMGVFLLSFFVFMLINTGVVWIWLINIIWLYLWTFALYIPFVALFKLIQNDR